MLELQMKLSQQSLKLQDCKIIKQAIGVDEYEITFWSIVNLKKNIQENFWEHYFDPLQL